jgi:hypothetical protein
LAHAIPFTGTIEVTEINTGFGLEIFTIPPAGTQIPISFELDNIAGDSDLILPDPVFEIGTNENFVNFFFGDTIQRAVEVEFQLNASTPTLPSPVVVSGSTFGNFFPISAQTGEVDWVDPVLFNFGLPSPIDGTLSLSLDDVTFDVPGKAPVGAIVRVVEAATVPEPATLGLIGSGLVGIAYAARRRRREAAAV